MRKLIAVGRDTVCVAQLVSTEPVGLLYTCSHPFHKEHARGSATVHLIRR